MSKQQTITAKHQEFTFGKYKGKTVREVLRTDPGYILWLHENDVVEFPEDLVIEAEENDDAQGYQFRVSFGDTWEDHK